MTTTPGITVSLILTSQDRCDFLNRFLQSLTKQQFPHSVELIFVNQGFYDPLQKVTLPNFINYKMIAVGQAIPLSTARNIGLQLVTGTIVAFPDDDCWYEPLLLSKIVHYFQENHKIACVCTNVYDPNRQKSYGSRPIGLRQKVNFGNLFKLPISVGIFCLVETLDHVGRKFNDNLGAGTILGSGEETELLSRLLESGHQVEYNGQIQVYHPVNDYVETDCDKYYRYGLGFGYLNGCLMRKGHYTILRFLAKTVLWSFFGALLNMLSEIKRKLYWYRLCGIVKGMITGIRGDASA